MGMKERYALYAAGALIIIMGVVMTVSVANDTYTTDELLYIPTGYHYLTNASMRLGFEHPPLVRDIAAVPLLFMNLAPTDEFWNPSTPGAQLSDAVWNFGENFLFNQTQPPETILFWPRFIMILLTLAFGATVFWVVRKEWGSWPGLLALTLFSTSPLILGHGRLVTMDVPAAFAAFVSTYLFIQFLRKPNRNRAIAVGVVLGVAQLVKFSLLLLIPFFIIFAVGWFLLRERAVRNVFRRLWRLLPLVGVVLVVCVAVIWVVYQVQIWNYSPTQQAQDIHDVLSSARPGLYEKIPWFPELAKAPVLRPLVQYSFGVLWQYSRGGAFAYFIGEGSGTGFNFFYPVGYLIKEPLAFHILTLLGLWFILRRFRKEKKMGPFAVAALGWVVFYWLVMVLLNPINTGIRYLIPTLPFLYCIIAAGVGRWLQRPTESSAPWKYTLIGALIGWQVVSVAAVYPGFLSYFNESIGGSYEGYQYLVDTDVEWGQNAKRLADWVREHDIQQIAVPYEIDVRWSGMDETVRYPVYNHSYPYYLGERYAYLPPGTPTRGWVAVPAHILQWGRASAGKHDGWSSSSYEWLSAYEPVVQVGHSVFIYYVP